MMADQIGIKDIARLAGVSQSTVSKVLKNYPGISEKTRERVMAVVDETGYIPNSVASALSSKTNHRIGLFIYINDRFQQIDEINMRYILGVLVDCITNFRLTSSVSGSAELTSGSVVFL